MTREDLTKLLEEKRENSCDNNYYFRNEKASFIAGTNLFLPLLAEAIDGMECDKILHAYAKPCPKCQLIQKIKEM